MSAKDPDWDIVNTALEVIDEQIPEASNILVYGDEFKTNFATVALVIRVPMRNHGRLIRALSAISTSPLIGSCLAIEGEIAAKDSYPCYLRQSTWTKIRFSYRIPLGLEGDPLPTRGRKGLPSLSSPREPARSALSNRRKAIFAFYGASLLMGG